MVRSQTRPEVERLSRTRRIGHAIPARAPRRVQQQESRPRELEEEEVHAQAERIDGCSKLSHCQGLEEADDQQASAVQQLEPPSPFRKYIGR